MPHNRQDNLHGLFRETSERTGKSSKCRHCRKDEFRGDFGEHEGAGDGEWSEQKVQEAMPVLDFPCLGEIIIDV